MLGPHDVVGPAVGLAGDHGQLGDRCLAVGVQQLGAVADDAPPLLLGAGQEPRDVLEGHDGDVEGVARPDEAGTLLAAGDVERAGQRHGLVGHHADDVAVQPGVADDDVGGPVLLDLEELLVVHDARDDLAHVVGHVVAVGHERVEV